MFVFSNELVELQEGEVIQLPILNPDNCTNQISTLDPPPPPGRQEDPRFTALRTASEHAAALLLEVQEDFIPENSDDIIGDLDERYELAESNLPPEISENFCFSFSRSLTLNREGWSDGDLPGTVRWVNNKIFVEPKTGVTCLENDFQGKAYAGRRIYPPGNTLSLTRIGKIRDDMNLPFRGCNQTFMRFEMGGFATGEPYKSFGC